MEMWPKDDKERLAWCISQGINPEHHCCLDMAFAISRPVLTPHQGNDRIVDWHSAWREYRIPVSYDGYTSTVMRHCPWCGKDLPYSLKSEWYKTLAERGFIDPGGDDLIPDEFNSDRWWHRQA